MNLNFGRKLFGQIFSVILRTYFHPKTTDTIFSVYYGQKKTLHILIGWGAAMAQRKGGEKINKNPKIPGSLPSLARASIKNIE
jgi:hypothetical protein